MLDIINKVYLGDCLKVMKNIPEKSIDCIITDLPYGVTACKWDIVIPFDEMWKRLKAIRKDNTPIVFFGSEPFSSYLRLSNIKEFKYDWIWIKENGTNFLNSKYQPLKVVEDIIIFSGASSSYSKKTIMKYNAQVINGKPYTCTSGKTKHTYHKNPSGHKTINVGIRQPKNILFFNTQKGFHPTQKPIALMEYLVKTYSNEGDLVLDFTAGSGTTAIACINTKRNYLLIEKEQKYFDIINKRIEEHRQQITLNI